MTFMIVALCSIIGMAAGVVIATELGPLFGFRNIEGSSAIFGVFTGVPLGLICGVFFGYRMSAHYRDDIAKRKRLFLITLSGIAALIASGFIFEMVRTSDYIDTSNQSVMWINAQIRLPPGVAAPDKDKTIVIELRSDKETRKSSPYSAPDWIDGPVYLFKLKAPARRRNIHTKATGRNRMMSKALRAAWARD